MYIQVSIWQHHALLQIRPSRFHNSSHFASKFPPATNSCYFQLSSTICAVFKAPKPYFLPIVKKSLLPPPVMRHPQSHGGSHKTSKHKNSDNTAVIAACSVAAFAFIGLFLFCCLRSRRNKAYTKDGQRDDRPLLNFCSSDISRGSSVTYNFGNSSKKDLTSSSNVNNISIGTGSSVAEGKLSAATEVPPGANHANLPLPPGRVPPPDPNLPLPPGRVPPPSAAPASPAPGPDIPATEPATPAPKPGPPPPPPPVKRAPPPPPKIGRPPPKGNTLKPPASKGSSSENKETKETSESDSQKAKLKPFFWDKVLANPEQSMVWNEIKAGSFQFNEEMMEDLFGYNKVENNKEGRPKKDQKAFEAPKYIQIIDPKKAHNLSILLKATNVTTEEVFDAITEGNELPPELIETLLKMAPISQEELKLRLYTEDISKLGPADRFIKVLVDIPFAYKRLESLLFMCSLQNETSSIKESFSVLEVACTELRNSRLFLKLLEAVLKTGNRMNDGTFRGGAQAFKLDTLLKLSDVKGTDGKTTLLHFVIQEIIRSEGIRAAHRLRESSSMNSVKTEDLLDDSVQEPPEYFCSLGLDVISNLSSELSNVRKAAVIDGDMLTTTATKLGLSLQASKEFLKNEMSSVDGECEFRDTLESFVEQAENDVIFMLEEEKRITSLVKSTADYFNGTPGKDEGMRLFMIVRDFLVMVDKVCQEVKKSLVNPVKAPKKEAPNASTSRESQQQQSAPNVHERPSASISQESQQQQQPAPNVHERPSASTSRESQQQQQPAPNVRERLFPAIKEQRKDDSSSDDSSSDDES